MRKVLSLVLVLALVLGSFSMAFAATPTDVAGTPSSEAVTVLMGLGVVNGYADGTFKPAGIVTRAEMAKLIVVALGLKDYAVGTSKYPDMAGATWAQGFVNYASSLGVIEGYPGGTFGPSLTVTYDEAAAMIVRALGYTDDALTGTWPANYVLKARALGILDGIKSVVGGANRGDIAQMLYNALDVEIGYVNKDGIWTSYKDTMLDRLGATFIDADTTDGGIIFGDEDTVINLRPYVGAYADRYTNDDGDIIMVKPVSTFITGKYDSGDNVFTVGDVDYKFSADFASDDYTNYFYNGDYVDNDYAVNDFADTTVTLAVDLSGKTIKDVYSIKKWDVHGESALFTTTMAKEITKDKSLLHNDFFQDDNNAIDLNSFELFGVASLDKIAVDNVVYVYDGDYIRKIEVGTVKLSGTISKISSGDDFTIGGKVYSVSDYAEFDPSDFNAGDTVDVRLDYAGDLYSMEATSSATNYAVVLASANGSTGLNGNDPKLKLFLADGTDKTFAVADSITGTDLTWNSTPTPGAIIEYGVDKDGVLDTYTTVANVAGTGSLTAKGYYEGHAFTSDAVLFTYDGGTVSDEGSYGITTLAKVLDTNSVDSNYVVDTDSDKIAAILITSSLTSDDTYGVVTDWATVDTDAGYIYSFLINGVAKDYDTTSAGDSSFNNFTMLYLLNFNAADEVVGLVHQHGIILANTTVDSDIMSATAHADLTLDKDVVVYVWDEANTVYTVGDTSDIDGAAYVQAFDLVDEDGVIDTVLVDVDNDLHAFTLTE